MRRSLKLLGLILIVVGATLTLVPTGAFSTIASERGVGVSVADDSSALVAVSDSDRVVTDSGGARAAAIVNNLESSVTVEYEASVDTTALEVEESSDTVTVLEGGSEPIEVACAPSEGGSGTATLRITIVEAQGNSATVSDATLTATVDYRCPPPSEGRDEDGSDDDDDSDDDDSDDGDDDGDSDDDSDDDDDDDDDDSDDDDDDDDEGNGNDDD